MECDKNVLLRIVFSMYSSSIMSPTYIYAIRIIYISQYWMTGNYKN